MLAFRASALAVFMVIPKVPILYYTASVINLNSVYTRGAENEMMKTDTDTGCYAPRAGKFVDFKHLTNARSRGTIAA